MSKTRDISKDTEANRLSFGDRGLRILTTIGQPGEIYGVLEAIEDCEFTADCNSNGGIDSIDLTLKEGRLLYGNFDNIDIASGSLVGYLK